MSRGGGAGGGMIKTIVNLTWLKMFKKTNKENRKHKYVSKKK